MGRSWGIHPPLPWSPLGCLPRVTVMDYSYRQNEFASQNEFCGLSSKDLKHCIANYNEVSCILSFRYQTHSKFEVKIAKKLLCCMSCGDIGRPMEKQKKKLGPNSRALALWPW